MHGGRVKLADLGLATNDAAELAKAVIRKAVKSVPDPVTLNAAALGAWTGLGAHS